MTARVEAGTATGTVRVRPLRAIDAATEERWWDLAARAVEPNPFAAPGAALAAARHLPDGGDALLLSVAHGDALTFALPVVRTRAAAHVPLTVLTAWQGYFPPLATPLLDPAHAADAWRAVRAALGRTIPQAAWLLLGPMPTTGPVATALARASGRAPRVLDAAERAMAYRDGDRVRPSEKTRRSLESRRRKLGRMAGADAETFRVAPGQPVPDGFVDDFLALEASGWKGREGTALACRADTAAFFRDLVRAHAARGGVEIVGIRCGDRLVTATVNLVSGPGLFFYKTAYDEELHRSSPGRLLLSDNLDAFTANEALGFVDSCADPGASLPNQVLHDRRTVGTVLVPASRGPAAAAAGAALLARTARRRLRRVRGRT